MSLPLQYLRTVSSCMYYALCSMYSLKQCPNCPNYELAGAGTASPYLSEKRDQAHVWWNKSRLYQLVLRTLVHVACISACAAQCVLILDLYLDYPTTVYVYMERMVNLETPGITVCNNNRFVPF